MRAASRLPNVATLRDARPGDEADVRRVVDSVLREYGMALEPNDIDSDLADIAASYQRRGGVFRVFVDDSGAIIGCGGLYPLTGGEVELRKMYLLPHARGKGMGHAMLEDLVRAATEHGFNRIVLETASVLTTAIGMYRRYGFTEIARRHLANRCDQAFALDLTRAPGVPSPTV
jgi:putative acetyltransferase